MRKRSAGFRPLSTEPALGFEPSVTTPSIDITKFEYRTGSSNPIEPYMRSRAWGNA